METSEFGVRIMAAARKQFDDRKRSFIDVPEWEVDGQPVRIWYDPMTLEEHLELINYRATDGRHYAMARIVAQKATDEQGNRLFSAEDEILFCKGVAATAVLRIYNTMIGMSDALAELEKKLKAIRSD